MPKGMTTENGVIKILKAVYELKQSPRNWNQELHKLLISLNFVQSQVDHCLYSLRVPKVKNGKTTGFSVVHLTVYVDDVALFGDRELIKWTIAKVAKVYALTDQGELRDILGVQIHFLTLARGSTTAPTDSRTRLSKLPSVRCFLFFLK